MGNRVRTRTSGTGTFRCPRESGSRRYHLKSVRRWLFVGRAPVLPLREVDRFIECQSCASTFEPSALAAHGDTLIEDVLTRTLRCVVGVLLGGEPPLSADDRREAVIIVQHYANVPYNQRSLEADLQGSAGLPDQLAELSTSLNHHGRTAIVNASAELASRRGADSVRLEALTTVADALAIAPELIEQAVDATASAVLLTG